MGMQHWWNDTDRGKLKYWERNLSQCHFVQHKSHMDWLGIEPNKSVPTSHNRHRSAAARTNQLML